MLYKNKVISIQDVIFKKDEIWDSMPLQYTINKITKLDEAIQVIELL